MILEAEVLEATEVDFADEVVTERVRRHDNDLGSAITEESLCCGNG